MRTLVDIFLPPGVQARLDSTLGYCPTMLDADTAALIEELLAMRNTASEAEMDSIDDEMLAAVVKEAAHFMGSFA
jgi:hypothetical protein